MRPRVPRRTTARSILEARSMQETAAYLERQQTLLPLQNNKTAGMPSVDTLAAMGRARVRNTLPGALMSEIMSYAKGRGRGVTGSLLRALGPLGSAIEFLLGGLRRAEVRQQDIDDAAKVLGEAAPEAFGGEPGTGPSPPAPGRRARPVPVGGGPPEEIRGGDGGRGEEPETGVFVGGMAIDMIKVSSSNVYAYGYDEETETLRVQYRAPVLVRSGGRLKTSGKSSSPGPVYDYFNVPPRIFQKFRNASSYGKAVWDNLRVRGTAFGHQFDFRLVGATEVRVANAPTQRKTVTYVPRKGIADRIYGPRRIFQGTRKSGRWIDNTLEPNYSGGATRLGESGVTGEL